MESQRVLVLPGSSNPRGSEKYKKVIELIEDLAVQKGYECKLLNYPGQCGDSVNALSYASALEAALAKCAEYRPRWIISRSFGCWIAVGVLSCVHQWVDACEGAILWGPGLASTTARVWPDRATRAREVEGHRQYGTYLAEDFFETLPPIEDLVGTCRCNLRIARGTCDDLNTRKDLDYLASLHSKLQHRFIYEVREITGLGHSVVADDLGPELLGRYSACLFDPMKAT